MDTVTVKGGDTLWDIACREFGDGTRWTDIYALNKRVIEAAQNMPARRRFTGPDWIYPGTILKLPRR